MKSSSLIAVPAKAWGALWTFPSILLSSFAIGWGAEAAQYFISKGLALAILAWFQTLPEFAVEALISWHRDTPLMLANLTGSLRLLVGFGWPMIYFVRAFLCREKKQKVRFDPIILDKEYSIEIVSLLLPLLYFTFIYIKGALQFYDGMILLLLYLGYLWMIQKLPPEEAEEAVDMPYIPRKIISLSPLLRNLSIVVLFLGGGLMLMFTVEPFLQSLLALASLLGISQFVFVQWISPFLSEFPEKLTAFGWARREGKAPMALMNMVSSNINQWTLLVALMMIIFSCSAGHLAGFQFDDHQRLELALTLVQSFLGVLVLMQLKMCWYEAVFLFVLWFIQFICPSSRNWMLKVYLLFILFYVFRILLNKNFEVLKVFRKAVLSGG
ncbi:MAG: hypothetical protein HQM15_08920 [Deltaproteobacteria bacterium]|nr:hypothetical protein [Deltaproteobacteria bacterium]